MVLLVTKGVDDLKAADEGDRVKNFFDEFDRRFKFGDVKHGPGKLRFLGNNTVQNVDITVETDADENLEAVTGYHLSRQRHKQFDQPLNKIKKSVFASVNSLLGWIDTIASSFCSFNASYLQQKAPDIKVCHFIEQVNVLRELKWLGTTIAYPGPTDKIQRKLSIFGVH